MSLEQLDLPGRRPLGRLAVGGGLAAFLTSCGRDDTRSEAEVIDLQTRKVVHTVPHVGNQSLGMSSDARLFVVQDIAYPEFGSLVVLDLRSGKKVVELEGLCTWNALAADRLPREQTGRCKAYPERPFPMWARMIRWSPDGRMIAVIDGYDKSVTVWDARTGLLLPTGPPRDERARSLIFTPDSKGLIVSLADDTVQLVSTETWSVIQKESLDPPLQGGGSLGLVGFTPDGSTLLAVGGILGTGPGALHWLDAQSLRVRRSALNAFEGVPKSAALSPDGLLLAIGASDGFLRVWDTNDGSLVQEIQMGHVPVQNVAFIDDSHLAVTPATGNLLIITLDTDELLKVVRASLTRGFITRECRTYGFDPCPTLEQLQSGG